MYSFDDSGLLTCFFHEDAADEVADTLLILNLRSAFNTKYALKTSAKLSVITIAVNVVCQGSF